VAIGAPHLVTSRNLEDHSATSGTRLSVLVEHLDCLNIVRVALVTFAIQLITFLTNLGFAKFTLPLIRKETTAVGHGTLPNESLLRSRIGFNSVTRTKASNLVFKLKLKPSLAALFLSALFEKFYGVDLLLAPSNQLLGLGKKAPFPFNQDSFTVGLKFLVTENLGTVKVNKLTVPSVLTAHTVRVIRVRYDVPLDTIPTTIKLAEGTLNLHMILEVVGFAADTTVTHVVAYYKDLHVLNTV
jgi:hypothetical protein